MEVRGLRKRYGAVVAVDGIDLTIHTGEIFGLLGPNGAGKTTAIKMLLGLAKPTEGYAAVFGNELPAHADRVRQVVGYVTQEVALDRALTARENLRLVASLYHVPRADVDRRIADLLAFAELADRADDIVRAYSGGMRKRLDLAMGLLHHPRLLIMDEPTLGLDIQTRRRLWEYVRALRDDQGLTILLTTHYLDEADQLCDRVAIIDHGNIVALGRPEELKAALGGDVVIIKVGGLDGGDRVVSEAMERAAALLRGLAEVSETTLTDTDVRATVLSAERALPSMLAALRAEGIEVLGASYARPTLDDVFLHHTGHSLRDSS